MVLDSFSGSGTTHEATIACGRRFVGADLFYEAIRDERLAKAEPDTFTPFPGVTEESAAFWTRELAARRRREASAQSPAIWEAHAERIVDAPAVAMTAAEDEQLCLSLGLSAESNVA